jgi:hypothetical protein
MVGIIHSFANGKYDHVIEMRIEEYIFFGHGDDMITFDKHHFIPDIHLLTQETL